MVSPTSRVAAAQKRSLDCRSTAMVQYMGLGQWNKEAHCKGTGRRVVHGSIRECIQVPNTEIADQWSYTPSTGDWAHPSPAGSSSGSPRAPILAPLICAGQNPKRDVPKRVFVALVLLVEETPGAQGSADEPECCPQSTCADRALGKYHPSTLHCPSYPGPGSRGKESAPSGWPHACLACTPRGRPGLDACVEQRVPRGTPGRTLICQLHAACCWQNPRAMRFCGPGRKV